jgi:MFS family permease
LRRTSDQFSQTDRPFGEGAPPSDIPARLDRLPWSSFHWLVIAALGSSWILDGLEVTLVGSLSPSLADRDTLGLTMSQIGLAASGYLAGAIVGAVGFGYFADRFGRKRLFVATVLVYALGTLASGAAWSFPSFLVFRMVTGAGIGGEYSAINSAIQELIPARCRGWTDLAVNGGFWAGALLGAAGSMVATDRSLVAPQIGWRLAFAIGGVLALIIIAMRRLVPESPRWLITHGHFDEAERTVAEIERRVYGGHPAHPSVQTAAPTSFGYARQVTFFDTVNTVRALVKNYPRRVIVGVALMGSQAFLYNAVFFTYAMILSRFYGVAENDVGRYMIGFAAANLFGPLLLGRFFDSIGRKAMIAGTYAVSGILLAGAAILFEVGAFDATTQTVAWMAIFFVASAAASAAYLTVGETFPVETRALVIALFYAFGTAVGGLAGPAIFGLLIGMGSRYYLTLGYLAAAVLMLIAAALEATLGIAAEGQPLEAITPRLASAGRLQPGRSN